MSPIGFLLMIQDTPYQASSLAILPRQLASKIVPDVDLIKASKKLRVRDLLKQLNQSRIPLIRQEHNAPDIDRILLGPLGTVLNMEQRLIPASHNPLPLRRRRLGHTQEERGVVLMVQPDVLDDLGVLLRVLPAPLLGDAVEVLQVAFLPDAEDAQAAGLRDVVDVLVGPVRLLHLHVPELGEGVGEGLVDIVRLRDDAVDAGIGRGDGRVCGCGEGRFEDLLVVHLARGADDSLESEVRALGLTTGRILRGNCFV